MRILNLNFRNVNSWRTPKLSPLFREAFKRDFWHVVRLAENDVHDASALFGFQLEILEFELESSVEVRVFNGFFGSVKLVGR